MSETDNERRIVPAGAALPTSFPPSGMALLPVEDEEPELVLGEILGTFLRRWRVIAACVALVFGLVAFRTFTTPRVYEAVATFLVSDPSGALASALEDQRIPMAEAVFAPALETHAALLQGSATSRETARWLRTHGGPELSAEEVRASIKTSIVPDTQLIQLRARAPSPQQAERIASATAQSYVTMNRHLAQSSSDSASRYLTEQLALARENLAQAEKALRGYKESTGTVADDAEAAALLDRASVLRTQTDTAKADLAQAQQRLGTTRAQLAQQNSRITVSQVRDNAVVQQLRERLVDLEGQRLAAAARYTKEMPAPLRALENKIAVTRSQLQAEIRTIVSSAGGDLAMQQALTAQLSQAETESAALTARVKELGLRLEEVDRQLAAVPARQIALARLQRQVDVAQNIHSTLLERSQEIEVGRVMALGNATLVEPPTAPRAAVAPRVVVNLLLALVLGLGLGLGLALLVEQLDDAVHGEEEALRLAEAPLVGAVPVLDQTDMAATLARRQSQRRALEAYTGLRYSLGFMTPGEGGHTVLISSPGALEGKTTTAVHLAVAAALSGRRTVLIDADLRRPSVDRLLGMPGAKGLTEYLSGQTTLAEVMQPYGDMGLQVISSGGVAPNPMNLLDSARMRDLVRTLRSQAELIVFDSAPVLSAADSLVLAGLSDAVLVVCVPGSSHRRALRRSRALLNNVGCAFSGVVLNKIAPRLGYGYGYTYGYRDAGRPDRAAPAPGGRGTDDAEGSTQA
jgi:succinoglycan biosynthesis transport protein ExoP